MAKIVMPCPSTGVLVVTGRHVTAEEFVRSDLEGRFRCSACGRVHAWTKSQVQITSWPGAASLEGP